MPTSFSTASLIPVRIDHAATARLLVSALRTSDGRATLAGVGKDRKIPLAISPCVGEMDSLVSPIFESENEQLKNDGMERNVLFSVNKASGTRTPRYTVSGNRQLIRSVWNCRC